ncbi:hypothetical protein U2S91_09900 [Stenotrophomonas maltophilia]|nr:hypothetical protein [Stenotrophomonas maltophilia]WQI22918.1 hypothetical protein U2S91_09900 [Stenotrophomonas maltophilia]
MFNDAKIEAFASVPGYRLVDYKRVGLPVFGVYIDVLTEEKRSLHLISEYCLRLINSGVCRLNDVIALLGLSPTVVRVALAELLRTRAISGDEDNLSIAPIGQELLSLYGEIVCVEGTWFVPFDGILRKPFPWPRERLLTPKQLRDAGHSMELAPFGNRPVAKELSIDEVWRAVSELRSDKAADRLISIRNVRRAPLRFVPAIALAYRGDGAMAHVAFLVDGRPMDQHAAEFVRAGGMRRPTFRKIASVDGEVDQLRAKVRRRLTRAAGGAPSASGTLTLYGEAAGEACRPENQKIYALPSVFDRALTDAKERLIITSSGISSQVVDTHFLAAIQTLLERGVSVFIGLGPNVRTVAATGEKLEKPLEQLHALQVQSANLTIKSLPELSCTHLIVDKSLAVVGDYDWLSPDGSSQPAFRDRWSLQVRHSGAVEKEARRIE